LERLSMAVQSQAENKTWAIVKNVATVFLFNLKPTE